MRYMLSYAFTLSCVLFPVACGGSGAAAGPASSSADAALSASSSSLALSSSADTVWQSANLTNYESYPDPGSEECVVYNGCTWAGYFAALDGQQTPEWVRSHNIIAVHEKNFEGLRLKTLRLRKGGLSVDAVVYDMCSDSDCGGCCTENAQQNGLDFLIDIEVNTRERFGGQGDGVVEWVCLDC